MRFYFPSIALLLALAPLAGADSITIGSGPPGSAGITYDDVQIDHIAGGQIYFQFNGELTNHALSEVTSISLSDDDTFNNAEISYESHQWSSAVDGFTQDLANTPKAWLRTFIAPRLLDAANHAGDFAAAVTAWIQIVQADPVRGMKCRPPIPPSGGASLDTAAQALNTAQIATVGDARPLLLGLLLDVDVARKDSVAVREIADELTTVLGHDDPTANQALTAVEIQSQMSLARSALATGKYDEVQERISHVAPLLTNPTDQADALYLVAQAAERSAASTEDWQDAALDYMRVYVHFRSGPGSDHSAASLLKAAMIEQDHLAEPSVAQTLYAKVASEYKNAPEAAEAQQALDQLKAARLSQSSQ